MHEYFFVWIKIAILKQEFYIHSDIYLVKQNSTVVNIFFVR